MRALSIRQPFVELILRGQKTVEYRSRPTRIIGERFYLYASRTWALGSGLNGGTKAWSTDLAAPNADDAALPWMLELAEGLRLFRAGELPTGLIVGTAQIVDVERRDDGMYGWHLADVQRAAHPRRPTGHPQPVWFRPF
jgi:hypothetical protein